MPEQKHSLIQTCISIPEIVTTFCVLPTFVDHLWVSSVETNISLFYIYFLYHYLRNHCEITTNYETIKYNKMKQSWTQQPSRREKSPSSRQKVIGHDIFFSLSIFIYYFLIDYILNAFTPTLSPSSPFSYTSCLFLLKKAASHRYQPNIEYQVAIRLSTSPHIKVEQGKPAGGEKVSKAVKSIRDTTHSHC